MTDTSMRRVLVLRAFRDIGTGQRFAAREHATINAKQFDNYVAAGLVAPINTKPRTKPGAKPKTAKSPPPSPDNSAPQGTE